MNHMEVDEIEIVSWIAWILEPANDQALPAKAAADQAMPIDAVEQEEYSNISDEH